MTSASGTVDPGGTLQTNGIPSSFDPIATSVTTPSGGSVTIEEQPLAPGTPVPPGHTLLGHQVVVTAPAESAAVPLKLQFRLDTSLVGRAAPMPTVFRDGVAVAACGGGTSATPDPCFEPPQTLLQGEDIAVTVRSSHASTWTFGAPADTARPVALVGSAVTQRLLGLVSEDPATFAIDGVRQVSSWDASGSPTIAPHSLPGCAAVPRPDDSAAGRTALLASLQAHDGCLQGARSSELDLSPSSAGLTYVPFARENLTFALSSTSNLLRAQTFARVKQLYECKNAAGSVQSNPAAKVMLPEASSDLRKFWLKTLFGTATATTADGLGATITSNTTTGVVTSGCVEDGVDEFGAPIAENAGAQIGDNELVPYSVAQWTSQASGVLPEQRSRSTLGQIAATNPFSAGAFVQRTLYNVFPTSTLEEDGDPTSLTTQALFKGPGSRMCTQASSFALRDGLHPAPDCGSTALHTP